MEADAPCISLGSHATSPVKDMMTLSADGLTRISRSSSSRNLRLFVNNAIHQTKGLVNSGFPWSGAYNTWGGHIKVKPVDWSYVQAGLYMAISGSAQHCESWTI